jgi:ubiquinone/menaquinone biosynthesis C-methylase UbiE
MAAARMDAGGRVIGLDFNEGMLAVARAHTTSGAAQVEWRHGNAEAMPFEDSAFDRVYCQQGLQFFSDAAAALREMRRVLAPGGMAILSVWVFANPFNAALAEGLAKYAGANAAALSLKPFSLGDPLVLRRLVSGAGFSVVDMERARSPDTSSRHRSGCSRTPPDGPWRPRSRAWSPPCAPG